MAVNRKNNARIINSLVIGCIIVLIGGIIFIFVRHRIMQKKNDAPLPPENTEANLTIKNFHHVATESGVRKWTLEAASASLYAQQNIVKLNDIYVVFYMQDRENVTLKSHKGELNSQTNDMILSGKVIAEMPPYTLLTESLNYEHHLRIIHSTTPVEISGKAMQLTADTLTYKIKSGSIQCDGHVEGSFAENLQ